MSGEVEYISTDENEYRLRFATHALQGIVIAAVITGNQNFENPKNIARASFEIADAMMEQMDAPKARTQ